MPYIGQRPSKGDENNFKILDDISSYTLTFDGSDSSVVSAANDTITSLSHRFVQGQRVTYTDGDGSAIAGLTDATVYFIIKEDHNTIKLATSASNASNGVAVNITNVGSGSSHTLNVAFDGVNTKFKATHTTGQKAKITRSAQLVISMNGVIQQPHDTATPSTGFGFDLDGTIVFSQAPVSSDVFWAHVLTNNNVTFDISDNDIDNFTGDGSTVSFNLSKSPPDNRNILVTVDGVVQYPNDPDGTERSYTVVENVLTFSVAPALGTEVQVRHIGFAGSSSGSGSGGVTSFYGRTGAVVLKSTDNIVANNATFSGDLTVNGTTTTLDTKLVEVDKIEVETESTNVAIAVTHNGSGDLIRLYDGASQVVTVDDEGKVGIGSESPGQKLDVGGSILTRSTFSNTAQFQHNALKFQTSGGAHIDHETTNQNLNFRVTKTSTSDTNMMQINAAAEQTKFRKIITVGLQGGGDTTQIGGGSGIGAYIQLNYANNNIVNTKLLGNNTSWLNSHYGNLGIGTQNPQAKFVVSNAGANGFEFNPNFNSNNSIIASYNRTGGGSYSQLTLSASQHIFSQGGTEYGRFNASGRLGIGTNAPTKLLEIYQADNRKHQFSYDDNLLTIKGANNNGNPENLRFIGDDLRFNTGTSGSGTEYFRITDTGEVKIMNTSGTVGLYFQSSSGAVSNFRAIGTNLQSLGYFFGNDEKIRFASDGTVGIGTNNPDRMLHIRGTGNAIVKMEADYSGSVTGIEGVLTASGANRYVTGVYGKVVNTSGSESNVASIRLWNQQASPTTSDSPGYITFNTTKDGESTATEKLRIGSDGKVGVGTDLSSSTYKFEVWDDTAATLMIRKGNASRIVFSNDSQTNTLYSQALPSYDARPFSVYMGSSEAIRIGVNGGVGIGTNYLSGNTSVYHKLMVEGDTTSQIAVAKIVRRNSSASNGTYTFEVDSSAHTSNVANGGAMSVDVNSGRAFTINGYGRVGIGTDSPASLLQVGDSLVFNGTELYPTSGIGSNVGHRLNYRRNAPQSRTNTGSASQRYYKIGEIVLNGSESAEINIYGTQGYSNGTECAGKTTIVLRATNGNTLAGFWYEETLGNANLSDVRWKYSSGTTYELWVKASTYANIAPFIRCTGNGFTSFNEDTGSGDPPTSSTAVSTYHRKTVGGVATIRYNPTDTTFHQNIKIDSGKGIDFSATADGGSLGSELFDDYESGTFTPTLYYGTGTDEPSYSWRYGNYVRVGKKVTIWFNLGISGFSETFTQAYIGGLPFQINDPSGTWKYVSEMWGYSYASGYGQGVDDVNFFIAAYDNQTKVMINQNGNHLSTGMIGSGQRFSSCFTYFAD